MLEREFESQNADWRASLEVAWQQVLSDSDGLLIDIVAEATEKEVGIAPDRELVHRFVLSKLRQEPHQSTPQAQPAPTRGASQQSRGPSFLA